jgi:hypothetical protein
MAPNSNGSVCTTCNGQRPSFGAAFPDRTHTARLTPARLMLLPHPEPRWQTGVAHAVVHLGLVGAIGWLAPGRS